MLENEFIPSRLFPGRRRLLQGMAWGAAAFTTQSLFDIRGLLAEELSKTPSQTEGPFYPDKLPLDTDNDLLILNDSITPAVGEITHLTGKILSASGAPLRNAVVEIWQVDHEGIYLHSRGGDREKQDKNFQGFGRFTTSSTGEYYFRTVKPVPYPGRTPHIHFAINQNGKRFLTTQCYVAGHEMNQRDGIFRSLSEEGRKAVSVEFKPMEDSKIGELTASFDIVVGATPEDNQQQGGRPRGRG
jgi:protocatechuate 3,4-dioxygenase beta subunit